MIFYPHKTEENPKSNFSHALHKPLLSALHKSYVILRKRS